METPQMVA
ncbi:unnamed protein product, partial [Didymodactylos carnosus]